MDQQLTCAFKFLREKLFCEKSNLLYDFLTDHPEDPLLGNLPSAQEIAHLVPNPCGWGTGMEDSMLNAGFAVDALLMEYERTGASEILDFAGKLFRGMELCARVHGRRGFVVRSVAPDGKSCYSNSSRDQFTLFVYGVWRYFRSEYATPAEKATARQLLTDTAEYCRVNVTDDAHGNLLRLDGRKAMVSNLLGAISTHEIMRLPMFYMAAFDATKDSFWRDLALRYAVPGIERNLAIDRNRDWWNIELSQMQVSLRLLYEVEQEGELHEKCKEAMSIAAELAEKELFKELAKIGREYHCTGRERNRSWRRLPFKLRDELPGLLDQSALWEDTPYFLPVFPDGFRHAAELLRAVGNLMATVLLAPERAASPACVEAFRNFFDGCDFDGCGTSAAVNLAEAAVLLLRAETQEH
ncbi:MAG: hypothetical protein PHS41_13155 [Victivallaceae bacterium]|nr:hypothetical protein [Victivallaceae bacterium]